MRVTDAQGGASCACGTRPTSWPGHPALTKGVSNQAVSAGAAFIVCNGNSCVSYISTPPEWGMPGTVYTTGNGVRTAANVQPKELTDATRAALEETAYKQTILESFDEMQDTLGDTLSWDEGHELIESETALTAYHNLEHGFHHYLLVPVTYDDGSTGTRYYRLENYWFYDSDYVLDGSTNLSVEDTEQALDQDNVATYQSRMEAGWARINFERDLYLTLIPGAETLMDVGALATGLDIDGNPVSRMDAAKGLITPRLAGSKMRAPSKVLGAAEDVRKADKKVGNAIKAAKVANKLNTAKNKAQECVNEGGGKLAPAQREKLVRNRPSRYRKGVVEEVWENAKDTNKKVYDPNTLEELTWDPLKNRHGQWDMGHLPKKSYDQLKKRFLDGEITRKTFLDEYNDPGNYRPEGPSPNRSRLFQ